MHQLGPMIRNVDAIAVYDAYVYANLIHTGKYANLRDALWQAFVPQVDKMNSQLNLAASALLYVQELYDLWLDGGWWQAHFAKGIGHWQGTNWRTFEWLRDYCEEVDRYAVEGTAPTRHLIDHFTRRNPDAASCDAAVLQNLHQVIDAATLFAYWTITKQYTILGEHLLRLRIEKAILHGAASLS